jgi:hypothetical protein
LGRASMQTPDAETLSRASIIKVGGPPEWGSVYCCPAAGCRDLSCSAPVCLYCQPPVVVVVTQAAAPAVTVSTLCPEPLPCWYDESLTNELRWQLVMITTRCASSNNNHTKPMPDIVCYQSRSNNWPWQRCHHTVCDHTSR